MPTVTLYPAAGANSPVDGWVGRSTSNESFSTIRNGAGNDVDATDYQGFVILGAGDGGTLFNTLYRSAYSFDTSSIPGAATITSASLRFATGEIATNLGDTTVDVVGVTLGSTSTMVASDYSTFSDTVFAQETLSTINDFGEVIYTLNSSGLAHINKGGVTTFGTRFGWDTTGTFDGTWSLFGSNSIVLYTADAPEADWPYLEVTYTVPTYSRSYIYDGEFDFKHYQIWNGTKWVYSQPRIWTGTEWRDLI